MYAMICLPSVCMYTDLRPQGITYQLDIRLSAVSLALKESRKALLHLCHITRRQCRYINGMRPKAKLWERDVFLAADAKIQAMLAPFPLKEHLHHLVGALGITLGGSDLCQAMVLQLTDKDNHVPLGENHEENLLKNAFMARVHAHASRPEYA